MQMKTIAATAFLILAAVCRGEAPSHDLSKEKTLYCVGYAHLDTQWRWDYAKTINQYLKDTLDQNFERFEKYPGYVFNFTGSVRYELMREYYPEKFEKLKEYVAKGRWFVAGSNVDEGDVNTPAPESIIRHVLYGNQFYREQFGKESVDFMLPDSFGFQACLPSILAHCGLLGFSTQKLSWGSAVGIPFGIGRWVGPDGKFIIAALNPGPYAGAIEGPVHTNEGWVKRVEENGKKYGVFADYHYYGVGDIGGAPKEDDVKNYTACAAVKDAPIHPFLTSSGQLFKDLTPEQKAHLPEYKGDLLLTQHSAGTLTSEAYIKKCNRKGEQLADAAERAAVAANWLGGAPYPREKLHNSWIRLLANQMHDIMPGTCISRGYEYAWNAEFVALNGFAAVLQDSIGAISQGLNTKVQGIPLVVYNPLAQPREDVVEAKVDRPAGSPILVRVFDPEGKEVPSEVIDQDLKSTKLLFVARVPPVSFSTFDLRFENCKEAAILSISDRTLKNEHYRVTINDDGDVASIIDLDQKSPSEPEGRELLAEPLRLVFTHERPRQWPAWNMDWKDRQKPPIEVLHGPAKIRIAESGPVRVALEITRQARDSTITQQIRLARGEAGRRVEFKTHIDWQSTECALRAAFPLTASNPMGTYNQGLGTIERGNNDPKKYEVPSREWFDLIDKSGDFGVSVLEDCKFGSDKPTDNTVRLTLLYSPGIHKEYMDQHSQDWGRHDITYALYSHKGDWREARTEWQARRLNQPLRAFQVPKHDGPLGRTWSLASLNTDQVDIRALKLADSGEELIVRVQELWGRPAKGIKLQLIDEIAKATEVDGQERPISKTADANKFSIVGGKLVFNLPPFSMRTFALVLEAPKRPNAGKSSQIPLPLNETVTTRDSHRASARIDNEGRSIPAEMLPEHIDSEGIAFSLYRQAIHGNPYNPNLNAVACKGQSFNLPDANSEKLYILAAAADGDAVGRFKFGNESRELKIQHWTGLIGQFDARVWDEPFEEVDYVCKGHVTGITPGFVKRGTIAWFCTHRHHPKNGNEPYQFSYIFKYGLDIPPGTTSVQLPDNEQIKIFAMTAVSNDHDVARPTAPLYDDFPDQSPITMRHIYPPPPPPVYEGLTPIATATTDRKTKYEDLTMGPPSKTDYADQSTGHGVVFHYFSGEGDYDPHYKSGADGDKLPRLNDGLAAENDDDTKQCIWYDTEGRFYADLGKSMTLDHINTYSRHNSNRAPQFYSLWASNDAEMPPVDFKTAKDAKWKLLALVDTRKLGEGGIHGASIRAAKSPLGPCRYLLWIAEDVGEGTFFTEIDIHTDKPIGG